MCASCGCVRAHAHNQYSMRSRMWSSVSESDVGMCVTDFAMVMCECEGRGVRKWTSEFLCMHLEIPQDLLVMLLNECLFKKKKKRIKSILYT